VIHFDQTGFDQDDCSHMLFHYSTGTRTVKGLVAVQGYQKSLILAQIKSAYATSY